ncbi:MAG: two pore domain potassium channel family protein [Deltaproteobacteria bacterium]|nr:two pore domain potassium channel family protein [Deltaproteobacteria bacterium]
MITNKEPALSRRTRVRRRAARFWATDWSLTVLLILLVGHIFIIPLTQFATWGRFASRGVFALIIISGVIATISDRRMVLLAIFFALSSVFVGWEGLERANLYIHLFNDLYALLFIGFLVILILRQTLRSGPITPHRVQGSVAVYLLLGILWAISYEMVELLQPGSFAVLGQKGTAILPQLAYFSFTTLTTLGFGDIVPLNPFARSLVMLEALVGQLFPVILIARLVTMEIDYRQGDRPH